MLVHVSRFTAVQARVYEQVQTELASIRRRWVLASQSIEADLRALWYNDFAATNAAGDSTGLPLPDWEDVCTRIGDVLNLIEVLPPDARERSFLQILETARQIDNENARARALSSLAPTLPKEMHSRAQEIALAMPNSEQRLSALSSLAQVMDEVRLGGIRDIALGAAQLGEG